MAAAESFNDPCQIDIGSISPDVGVIKFRSDASSYAILYFCQCFS